MSLRARIIIGFMTIFIPAFYFITDSILKELRPRYLEAVEESLNDTAHVFASLMETQVKNGAIDTSLLKAFFSRAMERNFSARIFGYSKTRVGLHVYVTDFRGKIIFDSRGDESRGKDYSRWNDVYLTLKGKYGARSTRLDPADPSSSLLYVAAPIMHRGRLVGVITVIKPQDSVTPFVEIAKRKLIAGGLITAAFIVLMSVVLTFWIGRPLAGLRRYVRSLRKDESARLPELGAGEIRDLGREFESIWEELKGKKYIEEYVQALTHELKSPLTSVRGAAELLEEDMPDEQRRRFYRNILRETRRMEAIIEKMLELSALEKRKDLHDVEPIVIASLASEALESIAPQTALKNLKLESRVDPKAAVRGERFLLRHALLNLLENAIRFSPAGGIIGLAAAKGTDSVIITITNQGPAIPDYALDKIFNRFYSLPVPDTGKKSTGLGLSFVREAAALHGGRVAVRNIPGGVLAEIILPE
jgi:two-component system, OmpR family, sensor histidine kinase CreC